MVKSPATNDDIAQAIVDLGQLMDVRFTKLETRFDVMDGRLVNVERRLTSLEGRLTSVEGRLISVDDRLTAVEGEQIATRADIKELYTMVAA